MLVAALMENFMGRVAGLPATMVETGLESDSPLNWASNDNTPYFSISPRKCIYNNDQKHTSG